MARRIETRAGIQGIRVLDGDTGASDVFSQVGVLAGNVAEVAFEGVARQRKAEARTEARNTSLQRNNHGVLVGPKTTASTAFPSIYSAEYDAIMEKRYLNQVALDASEKLAEYHNSAQLDPEGFRVLADSYINNVLEGVGDDAFEPARELLDTIANQHYTQIANNRAEQDYLDARAITVESISRLTTDLQANASNANIDDEARAAEQAQIMQLLEAELAFATQPGVDQLAEREAERIRVAAQQSVALGSIQRVARPMFEDARESGEIETILARATEEGFDALTKEVAGSFGGEIEARQAIESSLKIVANERLIELATLELLETRELQRQVRQVQAAEVLAIKTGDDTPLINALDGLDPTQFRDVSNREMLLRYSLQGQARSNARERGEDTNESRALRLQRLYAADPAAVTAYGRQFGLEFDERGRAIFDPDQMQSVEGMENVAHKQQQLLNALQGAISSGGGNPSAAAEDMFNHMHLMADEYERRGLDMGGVQTRRANGDTEAIEIHQSVVDVVRNRYNTRDFTKSDREEMDQTLIAGILANEFGVDPSTLQQHSTRQFQLAVNAGPAATLKLIETVSQVGGISQSMHDFLTTTGQRLASGSETVDPRNIAAAMGLFEVLKNNPTAMANASLGDVRDGFERLWSSGMRMDFNSDDLELRGDPLRASQLMESATRTGAAEAAALGLDEKKATEQHVRERLKGKLRGWFKTDLDYDGVLEGRALQYVFERGRQGIGVNDTLDELVDSNFNKIGYGVTTLMNVPTEIRGDAELQPMAPSLLFEDEHLREKPYRVEREVRNVLAERFSHVEGLGTRGDRIFLAGMERIEGHYQSKNNISPDVHIATPILLDDTGIPQPLEDPDGNPVVVVVNGLLEEALMRMTAGDRQRMLDAANNGPRFLPGIPGELAPRGIQ